MEVTATQPLLVRLPEAVRISGLSRSELYRRAGRGELVFRKAGNSTLVDVASLHALVAALPRALIRPAPRARDLGQAADREHARSSAI